MRDSFVFLIFVKEVNSYQKNRETADAIFFWRDKTNVSHTWLFFEGNSTWLIHTHPLENFLEHFVLKELAKGSRCVTTEERVIKGLFFH